MVTEPGIRFVMEGPHAARVRQKKRARLVTACDACRVKKVKCHQTNPKGKCDACKASRTTCQFGDRDKYHAERGMSAAAAQAAASNSSASSSSPSAHHPTITTNVNPSSSPEIYTTPLSPSASGRTSPTSALYASSENDLAPFHRHLGPTAPIPGYQRVELSRHRRDSIVSTTTSSSSASSSPPESPTYTSSHIHASFNAAINTTCLFDPKRPRYPHPELMEHLTDLFFDHLACHLPFLDRASIICRVRDGTLPAILANGIAALSSRFSDRDELTNSSTGNPTPRYAAGEPFLQMAKLLVVPMMSWPSIEVLHSLILIAWAEYGSARDSGLFMYSRMATAMLLDLGLGNPSTIQLGKTEEERDMLRFTWWSVARIDLTSSWVTGRPASLRDSQFDVTLPSAQKDSSLPSRTLLFAYLTELFTIRDEVTNMMNDEGQYGATNMEAKVSSIQARLTTFFATLPASLAFTSENFQLFSDHKQGSVLLLLHLMFHGSNALVHWPSLFKEFDCPVPHSIDVSYSSSRSLVEALIIARSIDPTSLLMNPFFDVPVSVAARAFLAGRSAMGAAVTKNPLFNEAWNESNLATCMDVLTEMSNYWGGAAIVRVLLEQRGAHPSSGDNDAPRSQSLQSPRSDDAASQIFVASPPTSPHEVSTIHSPILYDDYTHPPQLLTPRPINSVSASSDEVFGMLFGNHLGVEMDPTFDASLSGLKDPSTAFSSPSLHHHSPQHANMGLIASPQAGLFTPNLEDALFPPPSWMSML